jgi:hypothetical protein
MPFPTAFPARRRSTWWGRPTVHVPGLPHTTSAMHPRLNRLGLSTRTSTKPARRSRWRCGALHTRSMHAAPGALHTRSMHAVPMHAVSCTCAACIPPAFCHCAAVQLRACTASSEAPPAVRPTPCRGAVLYVEKKKNWTPAKRHGALRGCLLVPVPVACSTHRLARSGCWHSYHVCTRAVRPKQRRVHRVILHAAPTADIVSTGVIPRLPISAQQLSLQHTLRWHEC